MVRVAEGDEFRGAAGTIEMPSCQRRLGVWGSVVSFLSGAWGGALVEIEVGDF